MFLGTAVQSSFGKRSLPDSDDTSLNYNWARIIQILHEMEEHFHSLGVIKKHDEDCKKLSLICQISADETVPNKSEDKLRTNKLKNLSSELK